MFQGEFRKAFMGFQNCMVFSPLHVTPKQMHITFSQFSIFWNFLFLCWYKCDQQHNKAKSVKYGCSVEQKSELYISFPLVWQLNIIENLISHDPYGLWRFIIYKSIHGYLPSNFLTPTVVCGFLICHTVHPVGVFVLIMNNAGESRNCGTLLCHINVASGSRCSEVFSDVINQWLRIPHPCRAKK